MLFFRRIQFIRYRFLPRVGPGSLILLAVFVLPVFVGCQTPQTVDLEVPTAWTSDGIRWWRVGTDTTGVFRNLETLTSMGITGAGLNFNSAAFGTSLDDAARRRLITHVKERLLPLFRNQPAIVDSLFEALVVPKMASARITGDVRSVVMTFKTEGYRIISRHFREPYTRTKLGKDIPVQFPDSLREAGVKGKVFMQVFIGKDGHPQAIMKLSGVHPILDRIAMRATSQMEWQPAYLLKGGQSRPVNSWARFRVNFSSGK